MTFSLVVSLSFPSYSDKDANLRLISGYSTDAQTSTDESWHSRYRGSGQQGRLLHLLQLSPWTGSSHPTFWQCWHQRVWVHWAYCQGMCGAYPAACYKVCKVCPLLPYPSLIESLVLCPWVFADKNWNTKENSSPMWVERDFISYACQSFSN